jgi:hypothetical protein
MSRSVSGPLGAKFGRDPFDFVVNMVRQEVNSFRALTARMSERTGIKTWVTPYKDKNGKRYAARMVARSSDSPMVVATIVTLWARRDPGGLIDEAGRLAFRLPIGARSLDTMSAMGRQNWPVVYGGGKGEDPITIGTILTAGVTLLVALVPIVLPRLLAAIGAIAEGASPEEIINAAVTGRSPEPDAPPPPPPPPPSLFGIPENYVLIGAAALLGFVVLRG